MVLAAPIGYCLWAKYKRETDKDVEDDKIEEVELPVNTTSTIDQRSLNERRPPPSIYYNWDE